MLVEKPMGCNIDEARKMTAAALKSGRHLKVGFNHRYHPAILRAHEIYNAGGIGAAINVRARYGHGGRPGYEREWRAKPELAGGGELTDQGVHLLDLFHWFLGMPVDVFTYLQTTVWRIEPLEDNGFALLRFSDGAIASMHSSWTQWKNLFSFELTGNAGALVVEGLGGTYGPERLIVVKRRLEGGVPEVREEQFGSEDLSWQAEWADFIAALNGADYYGTPKDGVAVMATLEALYSSAQRHEPIDPRRFLDVNLR